MLFPESWLRSFVDPPLDSAALAESLTMAGLEVEAREPVAGPLPQVVVAELLQVERHPNAERLTVCQVSVGASATLTIVCGAPNARAGIKAPCALVGAQLPSMSIGANEVRGVLSQGMLCSAKELGISDDHAGILELDPNLSPGTPIADALELGDSVFTLKLTPNRGDCLSLFGLAREVSAITGTNYAIPFHHRPVIPASTRRRGVQLKAGDACPRYCGRAVEGVNCAAPTPAWMKRRLLRCGLRSVSAVVDVTNYVMLELGQPLHAFDDDRLSGDIAVRWAQRGERLLLLNGQEVELQPDLLLITDHNGPVALAGVMGGSGSAVSDSTQNLFLESAFFLPTAVGGRARRLGLTSDAAYRFERGVDFNACVRALDRAVQLILEICGGRAGGLCEAQGELPARPPVRLRRQRVQRILGLPIAADRCAELLDRAGLTPRPDGDGWWVDPPSHRFDIGLEEDLIEEIARLHGYDQLPSQASAASVVMLPEAESERIDIRVRQQLVARDYFEAITLSFVDAAAEADFGTLPAIALANPIAETLGVMRTSLIPGLVGVLRQNLARHQARVRVFEVGRCFAAIDSLADAAVPARAVAGFDQPLRLGVLAYGDSWPVQWGTQRRGVDFFDLKGDLEALAGGAPLQFAAAEYPALHPGRCARITRDGAAVGWIGELHPRWLDKYELAQAPVLFEIELAALHRAGRPQFQSISRFPAVLRDFAMLVDDAIPAATLIAALEAARGGTVQELKLFDLYRGEGLPKGKKSVAFRVLMQDTGKTLTDLEADAEVAKMVLIVSEKFGGQLRS
jgi:phenylalanyl-tRNA synthetase beta chain